ncbi:MAG: DEAD/DEAH box helicase [Candidatus Bathyarchaeia archaeon]|nr:DEAD/DEAH box helicase [Candidatus Bathyarchaeota archaeon]
MKIEELNIPKLIKEAFLKKGYVNLYPPQEDAVKAGVLEGRNVVLASPTASGKTLIAELCILNNLFKLGGKALYLTPLKALTNEKYEEFKEYDGLVKPNGDKIKVAISTGDYDSSDPWLSKYDIVLTTNEKADSLLRHKTQWMKDVSTIVVDEIHLLTDPSRGPTLEVLLTRLMQLNSEMQILALSATIKNACEIAEWINAVPVTTDWRPVPLKEGIYLNGEIKFKDGSVKPIKEYFNDPIIDVALNSVKEGGQTLIFAENRKSAVKLAMKAGLALRKLTSRKPSKILEEIASQILSTGEKTSLSETLAEAIKKGSAFHHAGLEAAHRKIIEEAFKSGKIKILTATPTLAAGVNLPARTVIISSYERYEPGYGRYSISVLEYKQLCGRAGRPKYDNFGEAILIAKTEDEKDYLMKSYVMAEPEKIYSKLAIEKVLRPHVLAVIASGFAYSKKGLMKFFSKTFFAKQYETEVIKTKLNKILSFLIREDLVDMKHNDLIEATSFGKRVSELYIDPLSAVIIRNGLFNSAKELTEFSFLHLISSTPDIIPKFYPRRKEVEELNTFALTHINEFMIDIPEYTYDEEFLAEVKCAKVLLDWINETSEENILKFYNVEPGDLFRLVETASWLLYATYELAKLFNLKSFLNQLNQLVIRVKYGIKDELIQLASLEGVGRVRARMLFNAGFKTIEDLKKASIMDLIKVPSIGLKLSKKIKEQVGGKISAEELKFIKERKETKQELLIE